MIKHLLLFFALCCMGTTCQKEIVYQHQFLEKVAITPKKTTYQINDTLWLDYSNLDNKFYDPATSQRILVDSIALSLPLLYSAAYTYNPYLLSGKGFCDFIVPPGMDAGSYTGQGSNVLTTGVRCGNKLIVRVGIVPKVKGSYKLTIKGEGYVSSCSSRYANPSKVKYNFSDGTDEYDLRVE